MARPIRLSRSAPSHRVCTTESMLFNVPRNNALAVLPPASSEAAKLWVAYLSSWTAWNHVRTIAALAATVLFTIALRFRS
jgi:uncharacterized membrane protein